MGKHRNLAPGDIVENLELLENLGYRMYCGENTTYWRCKCTKCGNIIDIPLKNLGKVQKDCGCWRFEPKNPIEVGTTYGKLKVISIDHPSKHGYYYLCECECGKNTIVRSDLLKSGGVQSCGCIKNEQFKQVQRKAWAENYVNSTSINKIKTNTLQQNNTSGYTGVSWHRGNAKWQVRIRYKGVNYSLGYYDDPAMASGVYQLANKARKKDFEEWYQRFANSARKD